MLLYAVLFTFWEGGIGAGIGSFFFSLLPTSIAIAPALVVYRASMRFGNRLKYLPVLCGYCGMTYLYCYHRWAIPSDPQKAIGLLFMPIYSFYFFIGGYWVAWGIHVVCRMRKRA